MSTRNVAGARKSVIVEVAVHVLSTDGPVVTHAVVVTAPSASTPWSWNPDLARSIPSVEIVVWSAPYQAIRVTDNWIEFYNVERPHTALDKRTPDDAYFDPIQMNQAA